MTTLRIIECIEYNIMATPDKYYLTLTYYIFNQKLNLLNLKLNSVYFNVFF